MPTEMGATVVLVTAFAVMLAGLVTCGLVDSTISGACVVIGAETSAGCVVSESKITDCCHRAKANI